MTSTTLYVDCCESTNNLISQHLKNNLTNFFCVYTFNQTKGKGQAKNNWILEKNKNLAMSFFLKKTPSFNDLFYSFFTIIHLRNFLQKIIPNAVIFIKWSNDIIINNKKLCGILIEKKKNDFIIGIGINCNQTNFKKISNATSLKNNYYSKFNLHEIASKLQQHFINEYKKIEFKYYEKYFDKLIIEYHKYLFRCNQVTNFQIKNEKILAKTIRVDKTGKIYIKFKNGKIQSFRNKDISMIY